MPSDADGLAAASADYDVRRRPLRRTAGRDGALRPHWQAFAATRRRSDRASCSPQRSSASRGRCTRTASPTTSTRPPTARRGRGASTSCRFIVPPPNGSTLDRGLRQRARLLNAIAADLYGPQRCCEKAWCRRRSSSRHPGFLRAVPRRPPPGGIFLHLVAFDLARGPDGRWRVIGTRTQAPSGAGYALENRAIISRAVPRRLPRAARPARSRRSSTTLQADRCLTARRPTATRRTSCCSRRAATTRPTSSTPTSRASSASRWSRAAT